MMEEAGRKRKCVCVCVKQRERKKRDMPRLLHRHPTAEKSCVAALSGWASFQNKIKIKARMDESGKNKKNRRPHQASPTISLTHHWGYITERRSEKHATKITERKWKCYEGFFALAALRIGESEREGKRTSRAGEEKDASASGLPSGESLKNEALVSIVFNP